MDFAENSVQELHKLNEMFNNEFGSLDVQEMDFTPDQKSWSINKCLDHLIKVNQSYFEICDTFAQNAKKIKFIHNNLILPKVFGKMVVKYVSPDKKFKIKTFGIFSPQKTNYGENLVQLLIKENSNLIEIIKNFGDEDFENQIVHSPITNMITYTLKDCITLLIEHEKRHFNQALRIKNNLVNSLSN